MALALNNLKRVDMPLNKERKKGYLLGIIGYTDLVLLFSDDLVLVWLGFMAYQTFPVTQYQILFIHIHKIYDNVF